MVGEGRYGGGVDGGLGVGWRAEGGTLGQRLHQWHGRAPKTLPVMRSGQGGLGMDARVLGYSAYRSLLYVLRYTNTVEDCG